LSTNSINNELFFEIMCEKLPYYKESEQNFRTAVSNALSYYAGTEKCSIHTMVSPYRLICRVDNCPTELSKQTKELKGPRVDSNPFVIQKFLEKYNLSPDSLYIKQGYDNSYYVSLKHEARPVKQVVGDLICAVLNTMTWPEYMKWNSNFKWPRPIRRIVAMFGEAPVLFDWPEGKLTSSPTSIYYLTEDDEFSFSNSDNYSKCLRERNIFVDIGQRREYIYNQIASLLLNTDLSLNQSSHEIVENILTCSESPVIYMSSYDADFEVPDEIRERVMIHHQKYVPLYDKAGKLSKKFLLHTNYQLSDGGKALIQDSRRAISARMKEAEYLWLKDLETPLADHLSMLSKSYLHHDLGTLYQQSKRLEFVVDRFFGENQSIKEAARYLNIDLCMNTVFELPSLHGLVSGLYCTQKCGATQKMHKTICDSIHPLGEEPLPKNLSMEGAILGFCARLDQLIGFLGKGYVPKGSSDQFGLRRAGFGLIKLGNYIRALPKLEDMISHVIQIYYEQGIELSPDTFEVTYSFLQKRLETLLIQSSSDYGKLFASKQISWGEFERLRYFTTIQNEYQGFIKLYKRLIGLTDQGEIVDLKSIKQVSKEHNNLINHLSKNNLEFKEEPEYYLQLIKLIEEVLDKIKINQLEDSAQNNVMLTLKYSRYRLENYIDLQIS